MNSCDSDSDSEDYWLEQKEKHQKHVEMCLDSLCKFVECIKNKRLKHQQTLMLLVNHRNQIFDDRVSIKLITYKTHR